jgi:hypothetical protein
MTKLLGPNDMSFFPIHEYREVLSPVVEPADATTEAVINGYLADLGFSDPRPSSLKKLSVLLCSFLMQSMRLQGRVERRGGSLIIGWPHDEGYWRRRSSVGYKVAESLRKALEAKGWISHSLEAKRNIYEERGVCNGYQIAEFVPDLAKGLSLQSTELVYAASTSSSRSKLEAEHVDDRVRALWAKWKLSPLVYNNQAMFVAPRRFNNDALTRGGRFYGAWTTMKQEERLKCTIDGRPVGEVDVSGMFLTLLACISGQIPFKTRFKDPYECGWENRSEVKAIINETIGAGTPKHYMRGGMCKDLGLTQAQFTHIRKNFITPKFKCLQILKKGQLDSLTLSFHESEIMLRTVESLRKPTFILHDCLICEKDEELYVGKRMQEVFVDYCREHSWTPIAPAFSIDRLGRETKYVSGHRNP